MRLPEKYQFNGSVNDQRRFNHEECGDTRNRLYVKRTADGFAFHCHNCAPDFSGYYTEKSTTPRETLAKLSRRNEGNRDAQPHAVGEGVSLPPDFTARLSKPGYQWIAKYGISLEELAKYRIGYSPSLDRVILPSYRGDKLMFWQGRALGDSTPKYVSVSAKVSDKWFITERINPNTIVLVEDILSAIKVGRVCTALALLGSYIPTNLLDIISEYDTIIIWLDNDKKKEALKFTHRFRQISDKQFKIIVTDLDPKEYTERDIYNLIYA